MKLTIRTKLLGLSLFAIVIPLIISAAVIVVIVTQKTLDESLGKIRANSDIATTQYAQRMNEIKENTKLLAINALQYDFITTINPAAAPPAAAGQSDLERRKAINVLEIVKQQLRIDYLTLTDGRGRVLYRVNNPNQRNDDLAAMDPMLREALSNRKVVYGSVKLPIDYMSQEKLEDALTVGTQKKQIEAALGMEVVVPLIMGEEVRGALVAGDVLNNDNQLVDQLKQMVYKENIEAGSATLYLGETAVASSRSGATGRGVGETITQEIFNYVLNQGKEFIGTETIGEISYVSAYVPIKDISNQIIGIYSVSVRETWFRQFQNYIRNFIMIVIGAAILFSVLLTYIVATRMTKPIEMITEAANKISLGDLDVPIQVKTGGDEIGRLADSLDRMRISLKSAIERLRKR
ncbi:MAG TPA: cache domain-containing protein [Acidobacteriota bacterium]|nr:HAMP domain-containing protein [Acidobacteriota bacterium]HQG91049.1 cache domain-containing protein [Acidobacteriota bacterium]HQK86127.1 cache domain-containing protein [Acidobacteriota bacterium]